MVDPAQRGDLVRCCEVDVAGREQLIEHGVAVRQHKHALSAKV